MTVKKNKKPFVTLRMKIEKTFVMYFTAVRNLILN